MNRTDLAKEIARREALAAAWVDSAKGLRAELAAQAIAEFEEHDNGVTWTMRDLGRVTLPLTEETVYVADIEALKTWTKERHPTEIETVYQVRAAFQSLLLKTTQPTEDGTVIDPETGEVIPGLGVRPGGLPKSLSISVKPEVKALFASYATAEVARQLADEHGTQESSVSDPDGA